jgi:hypothetical protein
MFDLNFNLLTIHLGSARSPEPASRTTEPSSGEDAMRAEEVFGYG